MLLPGLGTLHWAVLAPGHIRLQLNMVSTRQNPGFLETPRPGGQSRTVITAGGALAPFLCVPTSLGPLLTHEAPTLRLSPDARRL